MALHYILSVTLDQEIGKTVEKMKKDSDLTWNDFFKKYLIEKNRPQTREY